MRYITQFVIPLDMVGREDHDRYVEYQKQKRAADLGILIGEKEGFIKEDRKDFEGQDIYSLEVVVFKHNEWVKFKQGLKEYIEATQGSLSTLNLIMVGKMIKELE